MAGRLKVGTGSLEPDGELLELWREAVRLTSLLRGSVGGVLSGRNGMVEAATDPFVYAAELGREEALLESRELDMLLDKRRNHVVGLEVGCLLPLDVRDCPPPPSSAPRRERSMSAPIPAPGIKLLRLFCGTRLLPLLLARVRPLSGVVAVRGEGVVAAEEK